MVFLLAAAGCRGGGKVGILVLDFHFSIAHTSRFFPCLRFCLKQVSTAGAVEMWKSRLPSARFPRARGKSGKPAFWLSTLSTARHFHSSLSGGFWLGRRPPTHSPSPWLSAC